MIYWVPFLHFYQPPVQYHAVLKKICNESYRPLLKMFLEHPKAKVTINICGVLTELLNDHGAEDILDDIKELALNKQLEFVDSAKYHAILPLLPSREMRRQIKLNQKTNQFFFKDIYKPRGFFPPEMCYSADVAKVVQSMEYEWILISGIADTDKWPVDFISEISCGSSFLKVFYRDDILSNKISFHNLDSKNFIKEMVNLSKNKKDTYIITAMDAETFGHHIEDWEKLFLAEVYETIDIIEKIYRQHKVKREISLSKTFNKIFADLKDIPHIEVLTISELLEKFPSRKSKPPIPSSWSTTKEDIAKKNYFPLWKNIKNPIHDLQWDHLNICFKLVEQAVNVKGSDGSSGRFAMLARNLLDRAVYSCQFWWANKEQGKWDINLINKGLMLQEEALFNAHKAVNLSSAGEDKKKDFYHNVLAARDIANKIRDLIIAQ